MAATQCTIIEQPRTASTFLVGRCQRTSDKSCPSVIAEHPNHHQASDCHRHSPPSHSRGRECSNGPLRCTSRCAEERPRRHADPRDGNRRRCSQRSLVIAWKRTSKIEEVKVDQERQSLIAHFPPSPEDTDGEAPHPGPRQRRRGPRSSEGTERQHERQDAHRKNQQREVTDKTGPWSESKFNLLHLNIRGWVSHSAELLATIKNMQTAPDLVHQ